MSPDIQNAYDIYVNIKCFVIKEWLQRLCEISKSYKIMERSSLLYELIKKTDWQKLLYFISWIGRKDHGTKYTMSLKHQC